MQAGRCWDEVRGVAVGEQGSGAQGKRWPPPTAVQGGGRSHGLRVRLKHGRLLGLLVLAGHFPVAGLDALFLHGEGPVDLWGKGGEGSFSGCVAMQQQQPELQLDSRCAV